MKAVKSDDTVQEKIIVARILSGGLADTFGEKLTIIFVSVVLYCSRTYLYLPQGWPLEISKGK